MMKQMLSTAKAPQRGKCFYAQSVLRLGPILDTEELFNGCTGSKISPLMFPGFLILALSFQLFFAPLLYSKLHIKAKSGILQ